jgi:hypothetical protein
MAGEELLQSGVPGDPLPALEQGDGLVLERVRVRDVLVELLAEVIRRDLAQRRLDDDVEHALQALGHRGLLGGDVASHCGRLLVARLLCHVLEQLVGRELHVLIGVGVRGELPRGVGVQLGEPDHSYPARLAGRVLDLRRLRSERLEAVPDALFVHLGLLEVHLERVGNGRVTGDPRRAPHLHQRLLLDGVDVGEVLDQLLLDRLRAHVPRLTRSGGDLVQSDRMRAQGAGLPDACTTSQSPPNSNTSWQRISLRPSWT